MTYSAASTAGAIVPIVGMGISLGILAHTARHVTDTMYGTRRPSPRQHRRAISRPYPNKYMRPYRPTQYRPRYRRY